MVSILDKIHTARVDINDTLPDAITGGKDSDAFDRLVEALGKLELYVDQCLELEPAPPMDPWLDDALEQRVACL